MTLSMHQASIPALLKQLGALSGVLAKGERHAADTGMDPSELLDARIAPDMFPLTRQVQIATDMAKGGGARLAGVEVPAYADEEKTFGELQARLGKTIAFLKDLPGSGFDGSEDREIVLKTPTRELRFSGRDYLFDFVLPNVYFHTTTAYALLRQKGVPLGKMDFLGAA